MAENSFWINILNLFISILILIEAYKKNNIILFFYIFVFQVLVIGQAINISTNLQDNELYVMYYNNVITDIGHMYASCMLLVILLIIWLLIHLFSEKNFSSKIIKYNYTKNNKNYGFLSFYYLVHYILLILGLIMLLNTVGGISTVLETSRPGNTAHGVTLCLLLITFGLYPLFFKIICNIKKNIFDIVLFLMTYLTLLTFSRMLACLHLLMFYMSYFYIEKCNIRKQIPKLFLIFLALFSIMVLYGAYRHSLSFDTTSIWELNEIDPDNSLLSIDLFYRIGIEGMSGFSGAISSMVSSGEFFNIDFGLSTILNTILDLFPGFIRDLFTDERVIIYSLYWYDGHSVISGALENFVVHFSIFSVIIYPIIFSWITIYFNYISTKSNDLMKISLFMIFVSFGIMFIRGTLVYMLFYIIFESLIFLLSKKWFSLFYKKFVNNEVIK